MQILVLNGVNLDVLARRDPGIYGGLSLNELERRIYQWANELDIVARCRQTNSEGEYIDWIHQAYENVDGVIVNPGAWSHYSYAIRDALELLEVPARRGAPLEHRGARGLAAAQRHRRRRRAPGDRQRARTATARRSSSSRAGRSNERTAGARWRRRSRQPLLVTDLVNILYLTGLRQLERRAARRSRAARRRSTPTSATSSRRARCRTSRRRSRSARCWSSSAGR